MLRPAPYEPNVFAGGDFTEIANGGLGGFDRGVLVYGEANHHEAAVVATKQHILDDPLDHFLWAIQRHGRGIYQPSSRNAPDVVLRSQTSTSLRNGCTSQ